MGIVRAELSLSSTPMFGRERELSAVCHLLLSGKHRLVTLTGAGGAGKSRLAGAATDSLSATFDDAAFFVDLSTVHDADLVPAAIGQVLGVQESGTRMLGEILIDVLCERPSLVVLDNFEQVRGAAMFVAQLLAACPRLVLLVTSRETLNLRQEQVFEVEPLGLPGSLWSGSSLYRVVQRQGVALRGRTTSSTQPKPRRAQAPAAQRRRSSTARGAAPAVSRSRSTAGATDVRMSPRVRMSDPAAAECGEYRTRRQRHRPPNVPPLRQPAVPDNVFGFDSRERAYSRPRTSATRCVKRSRSERPRLRRSPERIDRPERLHLTQRQPRGPRLNPDPWARVPGAREARASQTTAVSRRCTA